MPAAGLAATPVGAEEADAAGARGARAVVNLDSAEHDGADAEEPRPAEEERAARPARDPGAPTREMIEAHAATHLPYRSWCPDCVCGRRDNAAHKHVGADVLEVPEVCLDYAFPEVPDLLNLSFAISLILRGLPLILRIPPPESDFEPFRQFDNGLVCVVNMKSANELKTRK